MLSEGFIAAIHAQPKSAKTAVAKDVGVFVYELRPTPIQKCSFKKSSTQLNSLAASSTHIFAAQANKAVVHVYSRERGNQEALVSFPERIHCLSIIAETTLLLGTVEGRLILWEICTGRQVSTPAAHLQPITCIASTQSHLLTGSEDSNINVWSIPRLLSLTTTGMHEPLRALSNHRAAIAALVMGRSTTTTNICVSASKDNSVVVWNYHTGDLLRTFLLPSTPLCLALDPCDRGVFCGFEDGSIQLLEFLQPNSVLNPLFDTRLQITPLQITIPPWIAPSEVGVVLCLGLSYDGTSLLSGHASGKIVLWDTGRRSFSGDIADLNSPVSNLLMESPFPEQRMTKISTVVKPKIGDNAYTFTARLTGTVGTTSFEKVLETPGFPSEMLEDAISRLSSSEATSSSVDEKLQKENEELWKIINEQRALQKRTWEKYSKLKSGGV